MTPQQIEILEELDGSRSRAARKRAAVRIAAFDALLQLPTRIQSSQVTAAPTQAQHNALQGDVAAIHRALRAVADAIRNV